MTRDVVVHGPDDRTSKATASVKRQGSDIWFVNRQPVKEKGTGTYLSLPTSAVRNNTYFAMRPMGLASVYQTPHDEQGNLAGRAKTEMELHAPEDVVAMCFGSEGRSLSDIVARQFPGRVWSANELPTKEVELCLHPPGMRDQRTMRFVVNPAQGFLITSWEVFAPGGAPIRRHRMTLARVGGIWFPQKAVCETFAGLAPKETVTVNVTDIRLNEKLPPEQFSIGTLVGGDACTIFVGDVAGGYKVHKTAAR